MCLVLLRVYHELARGVGWAGGARGKGFLLQATVLTAGPRPVGPVYAATRVEAGERTWQITHWLLPACAQK